MKVKNLQAAVPTELCEGRSDSSKGAQPLAPKTQSNGSSGGEPARRGRPRSPEDQPSSTTIPASKV